MYRKTINCISCEVKSDIIIRQTNYETEEIEVQYCPICSAAVMDMDDSMYIDDDGE